MAKFIGDRGPTAKVARRAELEDEQGRIRAALAALGDGDSVAEARATLQARLDSSSGALAKLLKDAPSVDHERKAIAEAKTSYEVAAQARLDRERRGAEKAATRRSERLKQVQALKEQLALFETGLAELEVAHARSHADRAAAAAALDSEVCQRFDKKLSEMQPAAAAMEVTGDARPSPAGAGPGAPPEGGAALTELQQARREIQRLRDQLAAGAAAADRQAAALTGTLRDFELVLEGVSAADLPPPQVPSESAALTSHGHLYQLLAAWMSAGAHEPFTWEDLRKQSTAGASVDDIIRAQLGPFWARWYAQADAPNGTLPRQLVILIFQALEALKLQHENVESIKAGAAASYAVLRESHKRLRTSAA